MRYPAMRHLLTFQYVDAVVKAGSMRGAAETLSISPSALTRRILALEAELGAPIFERMARGVRLSPAGEILIQHIRAQVSDMERVKSEVADLAGIHRGHVTIACSQALLPYFLAHQLIVFRRTYPGVTFNVLARDREIASQTLWDYTADLALIFEPVWLTDCKTLLTIEQPIHAIMSQRHPLAQQKQVRLIDCLEYPIALPSAPYGVRSRMDRVAARRGIKINPTIESDSFDFLRNIAANTQIISFQIEIGLQKKKVHNGMVYRPVDPRDMLPGSIYVVQLRERTLSVAAARFAYQLVGNLAKMYPGTNRKTKS